MRTRATSLLIVAIVLTGAVSYAAETPADRAARASVQRMYDKQRKIKNAYVARVIARFTPGGQYDGSAHIDGSFSFSNSEKACYCWNRSWQNIVCFYHDGRSAPGGHMPWPSYY